LGKQPNQMKKRKMSGAGNIDRVPNRLGLKMWGKGNRKTLVKLGEKYLQVV